MGDAEPPTKLPSNVAERLRWKLVKRLKSLLGGVLMFCVNLALNCSLFCISDAWRKEQIVLCLDRVREWNIDDWQGFRFEFFQTNYDWQLTCCRFPLNTFAKLFVSNKWYRLRLPIIKPNVLVKWFIFFYVDWIFFLFYFYFCFLKIKQKLLSGTL